MILAEVSAKSALTIVKMFHDCLLYLGLSRNGGGRAPAAPRSINVARFVFRCKIPNCLAGEPKGTRQLLKPYLT
jgi:hypothetical protein